MMNEYPGSKKGACSVVGLGGGQTTLRRPTWGERANGGGVVILSRSVSC